MPIYCPGLSRREFLRRAVAGAAALATVHWTRAATGARDPHSWILFSDTHIAADRSAVSNQTNMAANLQQAVQEVLQFPGRPGGLFINGDCAYSSGLSGDYASLSDLLQPLAESGLPMYLAMGNHDHRANFIEGWPRARNGERWPVFDKYVALVRTPHLNWFMLDSLEKTQSTPGLLGREQLDWLAGSLDANHDKPAVVMIHHNPGVSGNAGLKDTPSLFEVIRPRKQVKAYIYGHTHTWSIEQDTGGLHLVNLPPVAYVFKQDDPSGWIDARVAKDRMILNFHALDQAHKAHGQVVELKWRQA